MRRLAIIGASYLQAPLIRKARDMGLETHVFAWKEGAVGARYADYFYPISIVEKEVITEKCKELRIDGVCSIASDLAAITVNHVADTMGLIGNSPECTKLSTNKHLMRERFYQNNDPSPKSILVTSVDDLTGIELEYPVIVKPLDRSGSRGVTKLSDPAGLSGAIERAKELGFQKHALVEEFVRGKEYSIECISWRGQHYFMAVTQKYTTGAPYFVERAHLEPALIKDGLLEKIKGVVFHALNSLEVMYGASHTEVKISGDEIKIIEIGGRMGGDLIGSDLVRLSTGIDFVQAVIQVALGEEPALQKGQSFGAAAVRFVFSEEDITVLDMIKDEHPEYLVDAEIEPIRHDQVLDSSARFGYYLLKADNISMLEPYLPKGLEE